MPWSDNLTEEKFWVLREMSCPMPTLVLFVCHELNLLTLYWWRNDVRHYLMMMMMHPRICLWRRLLSCFAGTAAHVALRHNQSTAKSAVRESILRKLPVFLPLLFTCFYRPQLFTQFLLSTTQTRVPKIVSINPGFKRNGKAWALLRTTAHTTGPRDAASNSQLTFVSRHYGWPTDSFCSVSCTVSSLDDTQWRYRVLEKNCRQYDVRE